MTEFFFCSELCLSLRNCGHSDHALPDRNTMAFRGAYGELSLLRSFVKKGKQKPSLIYYLPS